MKTQQDFNQREGERGNVLFLILIAVALFAALSYAVTQSTRSGAGDTASETNLISSAQLTQYPAGIRTSVVRMIIGGVAVEDLLFNDPSEFGSVIDDDNNRRAVFHPQGGNATYQYAPTDSVSQGNGQWYYNAEIQIQNIGLTESGEDAANDLVAFLPYISTGICRRVNEEVGIDSIPTGGLALSVIQLNIANTSGAPDVTPSNNFATVNNVILSGGSNELVGQPFGCFTTSDSVNVYYHVLIER